METLEQMEARHAREREDLLWAWPLVEAAGIVDLDFFFFHHEGKHALVFAGTVSHADAGRVLRGIPPSASGSVVEYNYKPVDVASPYMFTHAELGRHMDHWTRELRLSSEVVGLEYQVEGGSVRLAIEARGLPRVVEGLVKDHGQTCRWVEALNFAEAERLDYAFGHSTLVCPEASWEIARYLMDQAQ
jgi:hypothetical protein